MLFFRSQNSVCNAIFAFRKLIFISVLLSSFTVPAHATCYVCDEVVEVTEEFAKCYISNYELLLDALETAPGGRQQINLAGCGVASDNASNRAGLIEFGTLPTQAKDSSKSVYILDEVLAVCLHKLITEYKSRFVPKTVFDLAEMCEIE